jgi:hypothetical protein
MQGPAGNGRDLGLNGKYRVLSRLKGLEEAFVTIARKAERMDGSFTNSRRLNRWVLDKLQSRSTIPEIPAKNLPLGRFGDLPDL